MLVEVDTYGSETRVSLENSTYAVPSLLEDSDGLRLLLVADGSPIPQSLWLSAHESGAQAILRADTCSYVLLDHFIKDREERGLGAATTYAYPESAWIRAQFVPTVVQMMSGSAVALPERFVHLHTHAEFSALDGLSTVEEILEQVAADEQTAVAITDHGLCAGHPTLQMAARKRGIKPIFGMEAYFRDDRLTREGDRYAYWHLILLAMDNDGLRNLWAMSTESYRDGLWQKPQIDWDTLQRLNGGIIATTACLGGPVLEPWAKGDTERAVANLGRLQGIFGDRLYVEIQTTHEPAQLKGNKWLVQLARERGLPLVATCDSHYPKSTDHHTHQTWLAVQTQKDVTDDLKLFSGGYQYHVMTEAEVRSSLEYLPADAVEEAVVNTAVIANRCTAEMVSKGHNPIYTRASADYPTQQDRIRHDEEFLFDLCMKSWARRTKGKSYSQAEAMARFEKEFSLVAKKGYCGYYLINWDLVSFAKDNGVLVGPGRGSGGGSFVAYLASITEIDPIEYDLLFERFMTEGRTELPDFDIDYPSSKKMFMLEYAARRWGEDHICAVGTHTRLQNKGALNDTARALKSELPADIFVDSKAISTLIDAAEASTAGLGLSWEELWTQYGDMLEPYREKYPSLFAMAELLRGRLKSYSIHAAGVIIDTEEAITGALPLRAGSDGRMVAQFDMIALAELGFVKFDMLNIRNLDTIQGAVDLIKERYGTVVRPYDWVDEYHDPFVWGEISDGWTLGLFQIETSAGTRLTKRFRPQSIAELSDVITLVRPGPSRSGLTEQYFRRKEGAEEVTYPDARMEALLGKTQGCMLYQEDILAICMTIAGYGSDEADGVRKILGKKQVEKVEEAGRKFRRRAKENGTDPAVAALLWTQMAEFAKYSFGKAHATAYSLISYWTGWFKFHYPVQLICSALSSVKAERIPEFVGEARRMGFQVLPPDINKSSAGFTAHQMDVRYGFMAIDGIGDAANLAILKGQPYTSFEDFLERKGEKCNKGHIRKLVQLGVFDTLVPNRRGLEHLLDEDALPAAQRCQSYSETVNDLGLPCVYDWENEPPEIGRSGKPKKPKLPPKKCTRACRQFSMRDSLDPLTVTPYTEADIRQIEMTTLGVFLSSTPFDRIPAQDRENLATATDVLTGPNGSYVIACILKSVRKRDDRNGNAFAFLTLTTEMGELDCVCFAKYLDRYESQMTIGGLAFVGLTKNSRGQSLDLYCSLEQ